MCHALRLLGMGAQDIIIHCEIPEAEHLRRFGVGEYLSCSARLASMLSPRAGDKASHNSQMAPDCSRFTCLINAKHGSLVRTLHVRI